MNNEFRVTDLSLVARVFLDRGCGCDCGCGIVNKWFMVKDGFYVYVYENQECIRLHYLDQQKSMYVIRKVLAKLNNLFCDFHTCVNVTCFCENYYM